MMENSTTRRHGGRRPNSGRPRMGEHCRVNVSISVDPSTAEALRELRSGRWATYKDLEVFIKMAHEAMKEGKRLAVIKTASSVNLEKALALSE